MIQAGSAQLSDLRGACGAREWRLYLQRAGAQPWAPPARHRSTPRRYGPTRRPHTGSGLDSERLRGSEQQTTANEFTEIKIEVHKNERRKLVLRKLKPTSLVRAVLVTRALRIKMHH